MKKRYFLFFLLSFSFLFSACGEMEEQEEPVQITMPYDSYDYTVGGDWTIDELVDHLEELGFTKIETDTYSLDEYKPRQIKSIEIDGEDSFDQGKRFYSNDEVEILYYNFDYVLTPDNCEELNAFLSGESTDYMKFAEEYDGRTVAFDAYVTYAESYMGGTSYIIEVSAGDYSEDNGNKPIIRIDVETVTPTPYIDKDVKVGYNVAVFGKVGKGKSEYFNMLWIDASRLEIRE